LSLSRSQRRRGSVAVEFAIAFPFVLLAVVGLMEFGRIIWSQTTLDYAVEAAARCAAIDLGECGSAAAIENFAASAAAGLPVGAANFAVASAGCGVEITGTMPFEFAVPALFPFSLTLTAQACYPV
jgi:Flp pilus assembly protein TadG